MGKRVGIPVGGPVNVKDMTKSTESEQEVMGMEAGRKKRFQSNYTVSLRTNLLILKWQAETNRKE